MNFGRGRKDFLRAYPFVPLNLQVLHLLGSILGTGGGLGRLLALGLGRFLLRSGALGELLDVRKEFRCAGDVLAQHFRDLNTLL